MTSRCIPIDCAANLAANAPSVTVARQWNWRIYRQHCALVLVVLGWGLGICTGCLALWNYAGTPGIRQPGAVVWPADTKLRRPQNRQTLVLFAHPHCPCSRATFRELERLVAQSDRMLDIQVEFVQPPGTGATWAHTDLWKAAAAIPYVSVALDHNGREARRFGARTSGESFLYDLTGRLVFQGGLTPARGHEGESAGKSAIACWVAGYPAEAHSPVFGCPLLDSDPSQKAE